MSQRQASARSWAPFEAWTGSAAGTGATGARRPRSRALATRRWSTGRVGEVAAPPPTLESLALEHQQTRTALVLLSVAVGILTLINVGAAISR